MKQFLKIFSFELKYYLKNKVFVGITLFLVLASAVVMFAPGVIDAIRGGEVEEELPEDALSGIVTDITDSFSPGAADEDAPVMLICAGTAEKTEALAEIFNEGFVFYNVQPTLDSADDICDRIRAGEAECAFVIHEDHSYTYYVDNLGMYDTKSATAQSLLIEYDRMTAMMAHGISAEEAADIMNVYYYGNVESLGVDQESNFWYTYIMIFALYMVILLYGQMVATNVATEKSSRAMEVLITSAKPVSMMFGKVLASCTAGLLQLVTIFGSAMLFYSINKSHWGANAIIASIFDMPVSLLIYMLVFFVLGFLVYAFMFGAVGSTASKLEDINTSVMPITMLFVIGFVVVMMGLASGNMDGVLIKICSFVPFTSSMAMFARIAMGAVPGYEIAISIGLLILCVALVGVVSAKIYRVGVLLYGTKPKLSAIIKAVKKA